MIWLSLKDFLFIFHLLQFLNEGGAQSVYFIFLSCILNVFGTFRHIWGESVWHDDAAIGEANSPQRNASDICGAKLMRPGAHSAQHARAARPALAGRPHPTLGPAACATARRG